MFNAEAEARDGGKIKRTVYGTSIRERDHKIMFLIYDTRWAWVEADLYIPVKK